jgi:ABC-type Zn2+ transport system substrate-binding protein/surface adhesin
VQEEVVEQVHDFMYDDNNLDYDDEDDDDEEDDDNDDEDDDEEDEDDEDHKDEDGDESEDDEDGRRLTMREKKAYRIDYVTQEEVRVTIKVAYILEFNSPDKGDWKNIVTNLQKRYGLSRKVIRRVFIKC